MKQKLVLLRGLPGSGKSSMAKTLATVGYAHHEAEHFFFKDGEYKFNKKKLSEAHKFCLDQTRASLEAGKDVVVANTFSQLWEMQDYIDLAIEMNVTLKIFEMKKDHGSDKNIPAPAVQAMKNRWQDHSHIPEMFK